MVKIPGRLEDLYPAAAIEKVMDALQHPDLSGRVREALGKVGIRDVNPLEQVQNAWQQARHWIGNLASDPNANSDPALINATGQLLSPVLGRVPMAPAVAQSFARSLSSFQCSEIVAAKAQAYIATTFGAAHCSWHSSTLAAMNALLGTRHVLVAKTDCVRIPGLADIGDILSDMSVREIGASNGASLEDWQDGVRSVTDRDGSCVLLVSPNGIGADEAREQSAAAVGAAKKHGLPVFELLADGVLSAGISASYGFPHVQARLDLGVDAAIVPLNLLLAGPSGAMILGQEKYVQALNRSAVRNGTALQGAELATSILAMQVHQLGAGFAEGLVAILGTSADNLMDRARRIAIQLNANGVIAKAREIEHNSVLGPVPWNRYVLHNWAVEAECVDPAGEVQLRLLAATRKSSASEATNLPRPIVCGVEGPHLILDLRFVDPRDDHLIVQSLSPKRASTATS